MKTVRNAVCLVGVCAAAVGLQSRLAAQAPADAGPAASMNAGKKRPPPPPDADRVLDLSGPIPIVIDEPGHYRLDRDWDPDRQGESGPFLSIVANDVTLDFRGHSISVLNEGPAISVSGENVTLRNGAVSGSDDQGFPLSILGSSATIEGLRVAGQNASHFGGSTTFELVVRESTFLSGLGGVPAGSILERNSFLCGAPECGVEIGDDTRVVGNVWREFAGTALVVTGDGNFVERNIFAPRDTARGIVVTVDGRSNLIKDNAFQVDGSPGPLLRINNGANVLEANVALPAPGGERAELGIQFTADGNAFGNNRLAALVPVDLGGTLQTDLGGNVGF